MNKHARVLVLILAGWASNLASAACVGPAISVSATTDSGVAVEIYARFTMVGEVRTETAPTVAPGAVVTIRGSGFTDGCHDVCFNGVCPPTFPAKGIRLLFIQGDKTVELVRVDASADFQFSQKATLPGDAKAGPATIVAELAYEGRYRTTPISFTIATGR